MRATGLQPRQDRCRDSSELLRAIPKFGRASRPRGCPRSPRSRSTTDSTKAQCVVGFVLRDFRPTTQLFPKARTQPSQIWSRSSRMGSGQSSRALKVDPLRASSRRQGKQLGPLCLVIAAVTAEGRGQPIQGSLQGERRLRPTVFVRLQEINSLPRGFRGDTHQLRRQGEP